MNQGGNLHTDQSINQPIDQITPRDLTAILGQDERAALALRELYTAWGYQRWRVNDFEDYDLYVRNRDFLLSNGVLTFNDANGKLKALKPDVTLSIVRHAPSAGGQLQRLHYHERVFRASPLGDGFEEITQVGLECLGDIGLYETCEVILLAARSLSLMGEDYVVDISHMGLVAPFLASCPAGDAAALAVADCLAHKNPDGIVKARDEFGLPDAWVRRALALAGYCGAPEDVLPAIAGTFPEPMYQDAIRELEGVATALASRDLKGRIQLDFSVINSASYYSGIVMRGYLPSIPTRILSGGRYDPLMRRLGRQDGAIGFAVYLDKLHAAPTGRGTAQVMTFSANEQPGDVLARAEALAQAGGVRAVQEVRHG